MQSESDRFRPTFSFPNFFLLSHSLCLCTSFPSFCAHIILCRFCRRHRRFSFLVEIIMAEKVERMNGKWLHMFTENKGRKNGTTAVVVQLVAVT